MKNLLWLLLAVLSTWGCRKEDLIRNKEMADGRIWTTADLGLDADEFWAFHPEYAAYGRLYTYNSAKNVCRRLGPEWNLPTIVEWQELIAAYDGNSDFAADSNKIACQKLILGGESGFDALLDGRYIEDHHNPLDPLPCMIFCEHEHIYSPSDIGWYWTASGSVFLFNSRTNSIEKGNLGSADGASCRCIRD